jgi:hypothetical protein
LLFKKTKQTPDRTVGLGHCASCEGADLAWLPVGSLVPTPFVPNRVGRWETNGRALPASPRLSEAAWQSQGCGQAWSRRSAGPARAHVPNHPAVRGRGLQAPPVTFTWVERKQNVTRNPRPSPSAACTGLSQAVAPRSLPGGPRQASDVTGTVQEVQPLQPQQVAVHGGHGPCSAPGGHDGYQWYLGHRGRLLGRTPLARPVRKGLRMTAA